MVLITIPNINIPLSDEDYTALQRMKVELQAKMHKEKGKYTWNNFFEAILHGEGEVAVEFYAIDGDTQVNRHVVLFSLGNYCYEFKAGRFSEKPLQIQRKVEKVLVRT